MVILIAFVAKTSSQDQTISFVKFAFPMCFFTAETYQANKY